MDVSLTLVQQELWNWADCKTKLRKVNCLDNVRFGKIQGGVNKTDCYADRCEQAVTFLR